jgi:hypothetical protein
MSSLDPEDGEIWGRDGPRETLAQVADLSAKGLNLDLGPMVGQSFLAEPKSKSRRGVQAVAGELLGTEAVSVRLKLVQGPAQGRVTCGALFGHLASLGEGVRLRPPEETADDQVALWAEIKVKATPLTLARSGAFLDELKRLDRLARDIQDQLPVAGASTDLAVAYADLEGVLEFVAPLEDGHQSLPTETTTWVRETLDFLAGSVSVALACPHPAGLDLALALLARESLETGESLGRLVRPTINPRELIELSRKAPGVMVVEAARLNLGANPYELGHEVQVMLSALSGAGRPVLFFGTFEELQGVLHGGPGGRNDPLEPVVRHAPDFPWRLLVDFAVGASARPQGGLPPSARAEVSRLVADSLSGLFPFEGRRLLPVIARRSVREWFRDQAGTVHAAESLVGLARRSTETLGGLAARPRAARSPGVAGRFIQVLTGPNLLNWFKAHLLGQDQALAELTTRLQTEVLTRPPHQPLRYCAQGPPGTGKSQSAVLLAQLLGVPYVNIDASSLPDVHMAASQLFGSGRGFVGSHRPGRLEVVARHHLGAVCEVSDLDHASPSVRAALPDMFLQIMETGEGQATQGHLFSCANIIFVFTLNLPGTGDEAVRKGIGFNHDPSAGDLKKNIVKEMKGLLSTAFLSRTGEPILFHPLDRGSLATIIERAVLTGLSSAALRFGDRVPDLKMEPDLGRRLLNQFDAALITFGARGLLENARSLAATAFLEMVGQGLEFANKTVRVSASEGGQLRLDLE